MKENYDILLLGRMFPMEAETIREKTRGTMQEAANALQWNLIRGLLENGTETVSAVSYLPVDSWPRHYRDPFVREIRETVLDRVEYTAVGFCNITCLKQLLNRRACHRAVKAWARQEGTGRKVILCYTGNSILMRAAVAAKKLNPSIRILQIIADLPEYAINHSRGGIYRHYIALRIRERERMRSYADGYVLLTEQMASRLGIQKPWMVMEGIAPGRAEQPVPPGTREKTIVYTGTMDSRYGILQLLKAFSLLEGEDYRLVLCGLGDAQTVIGDYARRDQRISFLGKLPHEQVLQLQSQATVLVNPRPNNEDFTKYSFPSKTLEYLASGAPVVAYKLDGIPGAYDDYIHYVPEDTPEALASVLEQVANTPEPVCRRQGMEAKKFVAETKTAAPQTKRILEFLDSRIFE